MFWRRSASGTRTSVSVISACSTMRKASLFSIFTGSNPGVPFSTTNPLTWLSSSSRAWTTTWSAKVPLPIHFSAPFSTQVSPSRRAVARMPPATSEPPRGSVIANAPILSIAAIAGSQRSR